MRKIFGILLALTFTIMLQSCNSCENSGIVTESNLIYNVTAEAEGQVEFSWFNGGAAVDGKATVYQSNDTIQQVLTKDATKDAQQLCEAVASNNEEVSKAAEAVANLIKVKGVEGGYHLHIYGYVRYGSIIFKIDEEYPKSKVAEK